MENIKEFRMIIAWYIQCEGQIQQRTQMALYLLK